MVITYPLLRVTDDLGAVVSGATVTIASVTDKSGTTISSPGATLRTAGPNISVDYDAEAKEEAWITLAISKVGSTFTGNNAAPAFFLARDSGKILGNLDAAVSTRATNVGLTPASGLVVSGSTGASVTLSGLPAGKSYVGQHLHQVVSGEARVIAAQSYASGNYTLDFTGPVDTEAGPFSAVTAGDVMVPVP